MFTVKLACAVRFSMSCQQILPTKTWENCVPRATSGPLAVPIWPLMSALLACLSESVSFLTEKLTGSERNTGICLCGDLQELEGESLMSWSEQWGGLVLTGEHCLGDILMLSHLSDIQPCSSCVSACQLQTTRPMHLVLHSRSESAEILAVWMLDDILPVTVLFRGYVTGSEEVFYCRLTAWFNPLMMHYHTAIVRIAHGCEMAQFNWIGEFDKWCHFSNSATQVINATAAKHCDCSMWTAPSNCYLTVWVVSRGGG